MKTDVNVNVNVTVTGKKKRNCVSKWIALAGNALKSLLFVVKNSVINAVEASTTVKIKAIWVTPEMAKLWLNSVDQARQRKHMPAASSRYAADMKSKNWQDIGETIKFDSNWRLCDGIHRLWAIAETGIPQICWVAYNIDPSHMRFIGIGVPRTLRQLFHLEGWQDASVCELASLKFNILNNRKGTAQELFDLAQTNKVSFAWAQSSMPSNTATKYLKSAPVRLALAEMYDRDPVKAQEFVNGYSSGANLNIGDPELTLRNFLNTRTCGRNHAGQQKMIYGKGVCAMKFFLAGKPCRRLDPQNW